MQQTYQLFFDSLERQKYSNYSVVLGHLNSDKAVSEKIKEFIRKKGENLSKKIRAFHDYTSPLKKGIFSIKEDLARN